ncbi:MAG: murein biosynthesis integral membrane protein MurJ [Aestuariivita sp.]|nr:murein biosynthesis integral membrane protein MurJ [Aestuariivita sp.]MCY4346773.1 murein biosynthesis integral membrane protein MurJ [Aestuariivita sp.]
MSEPLKSIKLVTGFLTVGVWTLASRVLGFVRDVLLAAFLGSGAVAEAFLIAFSLPNMFRRFFAEGAFNSAFVPLFSKKLQTNEGQERFAQEAFVALGSLLILLTLLAQLVMPWLVLAMASGFFGDERFELATNYGRIVFVYVLFVSLAALLSAVLNATGRFAVAAAAPVALNVILIGAISLAFFIHSNQATIDVPLDRYIGRYLVWGVVAAGIAQFGLVWWASAKAGYPLRPEIPRLSPDVRRLVVIAAPSILAAGVVQINLLVGRQIGSFFDGAIAWLAFADRLYQLPLGVIGIAIGVVLLPDLARRLQAEDGAGGRAALSRAAEIAMALTIPATISLMVIPSELVSVLFGRGAFSDNDVTATALAITVYAVGLPAFVLQKILQPLYFAREDTRTPFLFAVVAMAVNALVAILMAYMLGFIGAAIGTSVAAWVMFWLLMRGRRVMGTVATFDHQFQSRLPRMIFASVVMGATLYGLSGLLASTLAVDGWRWFALLIIVLVGALTYFAVGWLVGAFKLTDFKRALQRERD